MGVRVVVEVLDHAPSDLTPSERLVLVALAERCRDETRRVLPAPDEPVRAMLMRRCGLGDSGLTKVLRRLAEHELDVRVPLGRDGRGRPVYAYEGRSAEFVVPVLVEGGREGSLSTIHSPDEQAGSRLNEGGREGGLDRTSGQPLEPERVDERAALSLNPSEVPQPRESLTADQGEAVAAVMAKHGAAVDEAAAIACVLAVAASGKAKHSLRGYVATFSVDRVRQFAGQTTAPRTGPVVAKCEHGKVGGRDITGAGEMASRVCGQCESQDPAGDHAEAVAS